MFAIVMKEKIIGRWNRLKDTYRRYRFRGFAGWCMVRVLAKLGIRLRIMYYYAKRLDSATDGRGMREYKELGLADFEAQVPVLPERFTGEKMSRIKDAFSVEGNHAYGIYDGDVLAVYGWISTDWMVSKSRRLREDTGYLWDDYTHPAYRGHRLHGEMLGIRERRLEQMGKKVAFAMVDFYNRASQVGFERAGYVLRSKVYAWSFWGGPEKKVIIK